MFILKPCSLLPPLQLPRISQFPFSLQSNQYAPFPTFPVLPIPIYTNPKTCLCTARASRGQKAKTQSMETQIEVDSDGGDAEDVYGDEEDDVDEFSPEGRFRLRGEEKDYDKDPEFAEILGSCIDDPEKAQSKMKERVRKKRNKIVHTKTGSAIPMKVRFNKFDFSNSYIWFEFHNALLDKDVTLIRDTLRSWHIVGRLGGCNSMNMQLSQAPLDQRPSYDPIQGAHVDPTTFYNIGDLEIQDNLARVWVDIGNSDSLILNILVNALTQISSDYVGIKQVVFGGSEFENWGENLKSEEAGYSVRKI